MRQIIKQLNPDLIGVTRYQSKYDEVRNALCQEQRGICAYSEIKFSPVISEGEIDHFNPQIKNSEADGYENWFLVVAKVNRRKAKKWFTRVYAPTSPEMSLNLIYDPSSGFYFGKNEQVENLIDLVGLNEKSLVEERNKLIKKLTQIWDVYGESRFIEECRRWSENIHFCTALRACFQNRLPDEQFNQLLAIAEENSDYCVSI